jgi:hypothetical protein
MRDEPRLVPAKIVAGRGHGLTVEGEEHGERGAGATAALGTGTVAQPIASEILGQNRS